MVLLPYPFCPHLACEGSPINQEGILEAVFVLFSLLSCVYNMGTYKTKKVIVKHEQYPALHVGLSLGLISWSYALCLSILFIFCLLSVVWVQ